jgi:hypothetical protein
MIIRKQSVIHSLVFLFLVFVYGFLSWKIRPIADDYCAAAQVGSQGFIGYMQGIRQSWSGDFFQILSIASFVGWPLAHLPVPLLGFTTLFFFMAFFLIFGNLLASRFLTPVGDDHKPQSFWVTMSIILLTSWGAYWSIPVWIGVGEKYQPAFQSRESFSAVFGWPIAIAQYLIVPLIIGLLMLVPQRNLLRTLFGLSFLGLIVGTSGYALAAAIFAAAIIFQISSMLRIQWNKVFVFQCGILSGILVSFFSPGAQARSNSLRESAPEIDFEIVFRWILVSGAEFLASVFHLGVLATILFGFASAKYLRHSFHLTIDQSKGHQLLIGGSVFLVVFYVVISISELFTYPSFWHLLTFKGFIFLDSYLVGFLLARSADFSLFGRREFRKKIFSLLLVLLSTVSTISFAKAGAEIAQRADLWERGNASLPGISDIDPAGGWIDVCWQELRRIRDLQDRTHEIR